MAKSSLGALFFEVGYKLDDKGLKKAEKALDNLGLEVVKSSKKTELLNSGLGKMATKAAGILSIGYVFKKTTDYIIDATNAYSAFDDSLRKTGAKVGLNEFGLKDLAESTKKVALEFHSTAKEVSDAQEFLALAGYTLEEIKAASPTVIAAQKATGESMQLVSDIATDTGSAYGFLADQLDFVTDRMVYTTNKFNTNFSQLGEAMKYVAPIAKQTGMNFADLNAYLGVLANSGIKGSQAGTSLRMAFLRLQAPTKAADNLLKKYNVRLYKANGEFIGINNAMYRVEKATKKMSQEQKAFFLQQLFGTEAMSAINILFEEGIKNVKDYGNAIDEADGKTKEMARIMDAGLGGMFRAFESEKDNLRLILGEVFDPVAYDVVKIISDGISKIRKDLEEDLPTNQKRTMGAWEYTKSGLGFFWDSGKDLLGDLAGTFDYTLKEVTGTEPLKILDKKIIERGENAIAAQKIERDRYPLGYENIKLMDTKPHEQIDYLSDMYGVNINTEKLLKSSIAKKLTLGETIDKTKISLVLREPPKIQIAINGGMFTSTESINELSDLLTAKIRDSFNDNWDAKLKFESSLMGGNQ